MLLCNNVCVVRSKKIKQNNIYSPIKPQGPEPTVLILDMTDVSAHLISSGVQYNRVNSLLGGDQLFTSRDSSGTMYSDVTSRTDLTQYKIY